MINVASKLIAHRRLQTIGKVVFSARTESLKERCGENGDGSGTVNGGMRGPSTFAGVGHAAGKLMQLRLLGKRFRREIEEP
jgi:hypothetical protein